MAKTSSIVGRIIGGLLALAAVLLIVIAVKTYTYPFSKMEENTQTEALDTRVEELSIRRFAGGIRIPTVSDAVYEETDFAPFDRFKEYLRESYPRVYETMDTLTINDYGLVFRWEGRDPSLKPILFLSHYDVVPVLDYDPSQHDLDDQPVVFRLNDTPAGMAQEEQETWTYPPFSGAVAGGRIYGRGSLDMKCMLFSLMEAADGLIGEGFRPRQDIWFAFGHDEEVGGLQGATKIAEYFRQQSMSFDAVYDEGSFVLAEGLQGIDRPLALVGLGEKGFLSLRIKVRGTGGHSSMPPAKSSLVYAAEIIEKLNDNQMPARIVPPVQSFLNEVGGEMGTGARAAIANRWILGPQLLSTLAKNPSSNALIRTTTAITMARGSEAANVISSIAEIVVNFRILQGDTVEEVIDHVKKLCEGYDVEIETINAREPSGLSPDDTRAYGIMKEAVGHLYPDALFSSYITIGGTDAYKYQIVSDHIYRFMPLLLNEFERGTIHNENEYITIENYGRMIAYFRYIMDNYTE